MDSAKRLEQAVEKLEFFMSQQAEHSTMSKGSENNGQMQMLLDENKQLKEKQEQVKTRLDVLIGNIQVGE